MSRTEVKTALFRPCYGVFVLRFYPAHPQEPGQTSSTANRGFGNIRAFFNWTMEL